MSKEEVIQIFKGTKAWSRLPMPLIEELAGVATPLEAEDGHIFVKEGDGEFGLLVVAGNNILLV